MCQWNVEETGKCSATPCQRLGGRCAKTALGRPLRDIGWILCGVLARWPDVRTPAQAWGPVWPGRYLCLSPQIFLTQPSHPQLPSMANSGPWRCPWVTSHLGFAPLRPGGQTAGLRWFPESTSPDGKTELKVTEPLKMLEKDREEGVVGGKGHSSWVQGLVHQLFWLLLLQNKQAQNVIVKTVLFCGLRIGTEQGQLRRCEVGGWAAAGWGHPGVCHSRVWQLRPRQGCQLPWLCQASQGHFWIPHRVACRL